MTGVALEHVIAAIRAGWTQETSADPPGWSAANPAWGQCAVTALLIQDAQGGDLLRAEVNGVSHYWNRLPSGVEVDLTREQFGDRPLQVGPIEVRRRDYVLSFDATQRRYKLLQQRASDRLSAVTFCQPA